MSISAIGQLRGLRYFDLLEYASLQSIDAVAQNCSQLTRLLLRSQGVEPAGAPKPRQAGGSSAHGGSRVSGIWSLPSLSSVKGGCQTDHNTPCWPALQQVQLKACCGHCQLGDVAAMQLHLAPNLVQVSGHDEMMLRGEQPASSTSALRAMSSRWRPAHMRSKSAPLPWSSMTTSEAFFPLMNVLVRVTHHVGLQMGTCIHTHRLS